MEEIKEQLSNWIFKSCSPQAVQWLKKEKSKIEKGGNAQILLSSFTAVSRIFRDDPIELNDKERKQAQELRPGWNPQYLNLQQAARILLILSFPSTDPEKYTRTVNKLLVGADLNEQIAIYAGLPLYPHPKRFLPLALAGTRSNATSVFDTIALHNPYPREYFPQEAYNRLVLKAAFMERPFWKIAGIPERANSALANLLLDLISERWAAGREVNPMLWKLIVPGLNQSTYLEFKDKAEKQDSIARSAVALAFQEAAIPLEQNPNANISWEIIQQKWETKKQL